MLLLMKYFNVTIPLRLHCSKDALCLGKGRGKRSKYSINNTFPSFWIRTSSLFPPSPSLSLSQTKNPGHFTAWSSCLLSHEMYRKTQLAAGTAPESHTHLRKGGVATSVLVGDEESLDVWAERTHGTISGVRKGELVKIHFKIRNIH